MPAGPASAVVENWFGLAFAQLHPLLQALHRDGGVLRGPVEVSLGQGLARWMGRIATRRLGLLPAPAQNQLEVVVAVGDSEFRWSRSFNGGPSLHTAFLPVGHFPTGFWSETTGPVAATLGVEIRSGGWYWVPRSVRLRGLLLPTWLTPKVEAGKSVVGGRYEFSVRVSLPIVGEVLSYRGSLAPVPRDGLASGVCL
jgi:Domain of unknown function (DUF4166)